MLSTDSEDITIVNGIGSLLMDSLLTEVKGKEKSCIKAVYLHVLCSNLRAIQFYERRDFVLHKRISGYYNINKKIEDGYCYVRYINGGQPPWSVTDYMKHVTSMLTKFNSCSATSHHHHHHSKESKEVSSKPSKANCNHTGAQSSFAAPLPASVHSYTSIVLNKLPKLLPSGLPKISSLFSHINSSSPPKHNATHPEQGSADNQSDKLPSPVSSNYSSTQEDPDEELDTDVTKLNVDNLSPPIRINAWQTTTPCDQDYPPHLTTGSEMDLSLTRSASLSGSEEFHDSMSSLSQLHSLQDHDEISDSLTESDFLHMPTSRFTTTTVLEETKETHKLSSGIRIPNAVKQNPVSSLISSTINQKLKLKAPFQNAYSHHKSNGLTSSKSSSAFAKTHANSQHGTASSGGWSTTKKAVRVKSALTKSLAKIKPTSNNFLEDEEVLNSSSGSELGDLTNRVF